MTSSPESTTTLRPPSIGIILAALLVSITTLFAAPEPPTAFDQRRAAMLASLWADYQQHPDKPTFKGCFWTAEALFSLGKIPEARRTVNLGLDGLEPGNKINRWIYGGNSGFIAWPGLDCYVRFEKFMDNPLKQRYRDIYTSAVFYKRLTTSNHKIMAAVTRYLATQIWGPDSFKPNPRLLASAAADRNTPLQGKPQDTAGSSFTKDDPTGEKYINSAIADTVKDGPGEYASRPYGAENILPLLTISQCATDPILRRKAQIAYELSLLQLAPAYLGGHLATFSTRSYPDMETQSPRGIAALLWVYFGGIAPDPSEQWALAAMLSDYRLPPAALPAGTDRTNAYVFRSLINRWALYHYVNKHYVLFSRSPKAFKPVTLGQNYPCGVMWNQPDTARCSQLWITCPAADALQPPTNNPRGIHTHGVMPYEQQTQHEGTSLSVFNIPADFRNPYILGFIPGGYLAAINDSQKAQRIYLHFGCVLIALTSTQPFAWDPHAGIRAPAATVPEGASEFRIMATKAAVAIETALPENFPGTTAQAQLDAFRNALETEPAMTFAEGERPAAQYTDRTGTTIQCAYDGDDKINTRTIDYKTWPTLESPLINQPRDGNLTVTNGSVVRTYDFAEWTVAETGN
jgi:hypothetical protein